MKTQYILILVITVAVAVIVLDHYTGLINIRQLAGGSGTAHQLENANRIPGDSNPGRTAEGEEGENAIQAVPAGLEQDYVEKLIASITADQKKTLLENSETFRRFINQEALNLSLLQAARSSNLQSDPATRFLVQRGADNTLRELYLTSLINSKIPPDFPNEQQIQQYYAENRDSLKIVERVSIWQIFLPADASMDESATNAVASQADDIAGQIRSDKLDFAAAALQYSQHDPSRLNGGYMGIIKVTDLIPEIRKVINELETGETSTAVKSSMGYHILRKGEVYPAQDLALEQIRDEIRSLMINQARNQLRNAVNAEVMKTYPVAVDDASIEQWRKALLERIR